MNMTEFNYEFGRVAPKDIKEVVLGEQIGLEEVIAVARYNAKVGFSKKYIDRVNQCRRLVEKFSDEEKAIYGITTGLGENWNRFISKEDRKIVQRNNLLSHACSLGESVEEECVRAMMFVMLQHLGTGHTGIRLATLEQIKDLLNNNIVPFTPRHGSVGYLSLEAHISLVLIGEGRAWYKGELLSGKEALEKAGLTPIVISSKEGLSLTSGTTSVTSLAALGLYDAIVTARTCDIAGAMSLEVLKGTLMAMDSRIMSVRPHEDQRKTAVNIKKILKNSEIVEKYKGYRVQDALSLRCIPQLHGAAKKILKDSLKTLIIELNSSVDNPLIFEEGEGGEALMGCNADGSYVGMAADSSAIAITNLAKMSERRLDRLVNHHISELPAFLNKNPGLNNGLMIPQYAAAGIVGEMKILCHPATIDNFVTCANQEDYVSMGYNAARKMYEVAGLAKYVLATEFFNSSQAQDFYGELKPSPITAKVHDLIREVVPYIENDCNMQPYIEHIAFLIQENMIVETVEVEIGKLEI
ncbi:HAL/PAL/TAL family ammonia-lyase [Wukongibacter sp. M2B1]|uniref:HAL/PAL/TAL family ammonia-lyase n=1 Tax=Wukongibacter sp. M2B1 TaxID=3088895 RepID=UPI003D791119